MKFLVFPKEKAFYISLLEASSYSLSKKCVSCRLWRAQLGIDISEDIHTITI